MLVDTVTLPKFTLAGVHVIAGAEAEDPVPVTAELPPTPFAVSVSVNVAEYDVAAVGVNLTVIVHEALAASVAPQVVLAIVKTELPGIDNETLSVPVPVFVSVKTSVGAPPIVTVPNAWLEGESETAGEVVEVENTNVVTLVAGSV